MNKDCIFCKIAAGEIPATLVFQNEDVVAFKDLNPQAPTHILVIPKKHVGSVDEIENETTALLAGKCLMAARGIAQAQHLNGGYRIVTNTGADAGQSVGHLHFHLLAGRKMSWPPG
jgi:histidine triad (HIT) family protein